MESREERERTRKLGTGNENGGDYEQENLKGAEEENEGCNHETG